MEENRENKQKSSDIKHRPPACLLPYMLSLSDTLDRMYMQYIIKIFYMQSL